MKNKRFNFETSPQQKTRFQKECRFSEICFSCKRELYGKTNSNRQCFQLHIDPDKDYKGAPGEG